MRLDPRRTHLALIATLTVVPTLLLLPTRADACSVPVFRYALERWEPDAYHALVFHKGRLTAEDRVTVDGLHLAGKTPANIRVTAIDLDGEVEKEVRAIHNGLGEMKLPHIALVTPFDQGPPKIVWRGDLRDKSALQKYARTVDSPARRQIVERIVAGDTAVWVFLETGDTKADDESFATLQSALRKLEKSLELPEQPTDDVAQELIDPDSTILFEKLELKIAFSTLRLSRRNAAEAAFVEQLLATEEDLADEGLKPMVFPVFGRGRALWAYVGDGITEENLADAASFLVGPCSCQVKRQNPGVDLLLAADWEGSLTSLISESDVALPPLAGFDHFAGSTARVPDGSDPRTGDPRTGDRDGSPSLIETAVRVQLTNDDKPGSSVVPDGDLPEGDLPEGDLPEGDVPDGDLPEGDASATEPVAEKIVPPTSTAPAQPIATGKAPEDPGAGSGTSSLLRNLLLLGAAGLLLVIGASLLLSRKTSPKDPSP